MPLSALRRRIALCTLAVATLHALPGLADYPDKPIRLLVPFGAGGISDVVARALAEELRKELGQTIVVENRTGAGGNIAAETLKNAKPDGYTIMLTNMGVISVNPHVYRDIRFDPLVDFDYITTVADTPHAIVVGPSVPVSTLPQLIALAKEKPGGLSYATAGYGSSPHTGLETLQAATGTSYLHVPFKSGAESVVNVMGGQVAMTFEALPVVLPQGEAGKLKVLAIAARQRHSSAPALMTTGELGFPDVLSSSASGLIAPRGLAPGVMRVLNTAARKAVENPSFKAKLARQGTDALGSTPQEFVVLVKSEHAKWAKLLSNTPKR